MYFINSGAETVYNMNDEVVFSVLNKNKIVAAAGDKDENLVRVLIQTNEKVNANDTYIL